MNTGQRMSVSEDEDFICPCSGFNEKFQMKGRKDRYSLYLIANQLFICFSRF